MIEADHNDVIKIFINALKDNSPSFKGILKVCKGLKRILRSLFSKLTTHLKTTLANTATSANTKSTKWNFGLYLNERLRKKDKK